MPTFTAEQQDQRATAALRAARPQHNTTIKIDVDTSDVDRATACFDRMREAAEDADAAYTAALRKRTLILWHALGWAMFAVNTIIQALAAWG